MSRSTAALASRGHVFVRVCGLVLAALPASAQQGTINPRLPPPPPPPEQTEGPVEPVKAIEHVLEPRPTEPELPPASLPEKVAIPVGTRIAVVLDTPLSTRISRPGQRVTFRTSSALRVHEQLEIPPETAVMGSVVEAKRPGRFGKAGSLRVKVDRISLSNGTSAEVTARLDSPDMKSGGRLSSDNNRSTDLLSLGMYTLQGTLLGSQVKGAKGAAVGAGAGAAIALIIMMSHRGTDVYLEPGMPFAVILDQTVLLPSQEVFVAQQSHARAQTTSRTNHPSPDTSVAEDTTDTDPGEAATHSDGAAVDPDRPKLKRRPKKLQL